jgi:hypothetical protein
MQSTINSAHLASLPNTTPSKRTEGVEINHVASLFISAFRQRPVAMYMRALMSVSGVRAGARVFGDLGEPSALRPPPQFTSDNEYCALL